MISKLNRVQGGQVARGKTGPEINNRQTTIRKPIESSGSQQFGGREWAEMTEGDPSRAVEVT